MSEVTLKELLEAGVHFGHQTKKWNPKMKKYIFGSRQGIYIIDLQKTLANFDKAYQCIKESVSSGKNILFIGTKKQAQDIIAEEAERCGVHYVNRRWLGGTLTNFDVIKKSIEKLKDILDREQKGELAELTKKELAQVNKEKLRLEKDFLGIRNMDDRPDIIFIIDPVKEKTALIEARKVGVFIIGIVDTNGDPDMLDFCIPGNDDAIRSIKLLVNRIADAVLEGKKALTDKASNEADVEEAPAGDAESKKESLAKIKKKGDKEN